MSLHRIGDRGVTKPYEPPFRMTRAFGPIAGATESYAAVHWSDGECELVTENFEHVGRLRVAFLNRDGAAVADLTPHVTRAAIGRSLDTTD